MLVHSVLSAGTYLAAKRALVDLSPFEIALFRFALAGGFYAALWRWSGVRIARRDLVALAGLGVLGIPVNQGLFLYGMSLTTPGHGALLEQLFELEQTAGEGFDLAAQLILSPVRRIRELRSQRPGKAGCLRCRWVGCADLVDQLRATNLSRRDLRLDLGMQNPHKQGTTTEAEPARHVLYGRRAAMRSSLPATGYWPERTSRTTRSHRSLATGSRRIRVSESFRKR